MPLPTPQKGEGKPDFLERCMGDDIMVTDYDDEKQRYAVCNSLWKNKKEKTMKKLKERMVALEASITSTFDKADAEERDLTDEERESVTAGIDEMRKGKESIDAMEEAGRISSWMGETSAPPAAEMTVVPEKKDKPYESLGQFLQSVIRSGTPGNLTDKRLLEMRAPTDLGETFPGAGGFLVQQDFSMALLAGANIVSQLVPRVRKMEIGPGSNGISLPMVAESTRVTNRFGGILAYWIDEAAHKTHSHPEFRMLKLYLKKLIGLIYLTDEIMEDVSALESYVTQCFASEFAFRLDSAIIRGNGAADPLGILNAPALVTVPAVVGQAIDTVVSENIMAMRARMPYPSRRTAVWLINQEIEPQLHRMSLAVGTGGISTYMPMGGLSSAPYDTLYGAPILPLEQCSAIGNVGDVIYADLDQYLMIQKGGIQSASSIHVNFEHDETVLRFVLRCDGQPIPNTAVTPEHGVALSPFVTLAAR